MATARPGRERHGRVVGARRLGRGAPRVGTGRDVLDLVVEAVLGVGDGRGALRVAVGALRRIG